MTITPNRETAPPTSLPQHLHLPDIQTYTTDNQVKIYAMNAGDSDVVRLSLVFHCGSRNQQHPFTASATLNMLSEGTANLTSAQIAEKLDFYGIFYDTSSDRDFSIITVNCLSKFLHETLDLLEDILLNPLFSEQELQIYKAKRRQQLSIERQKPSYLARELFSKTLLGQNHPYGIVSPADAYDTLTSEHLSNYYHKYFTASNCFAVASGSITNDTLQRIQSLLAALPTNTPTPDLNHVPKPESLPNAHIERPEALQTSIRMGKILFTKGHPDYNGMLVVSMILGGYFGSRLVANLREQRGYTYGIYAAMVSLEHTGYIAIATDVTAAATDDAIEQIFIEIQRLQTEPVTQQELNVVKNMITGEVMRLLDGPFGITDIVIENLQSAMKPDYLDPFLQEVRQITPQQIMSLARKYLDRNSFTVVTVGTNQNNA